MKSYNAINDGFHIDIFQLIEKEFSFLVDKCGMTSTKFDNSISYQKIRTKIDFWYNEYDCEFYANYCHDSKNLICLFC